MKNKTTPSRILGIDYGLARIGIAVSDESKMIVSPKETISARKKLDDTVQAVVDLVERIECETGSIIDEIVIGMPKHMDGRAGMLADEVQLFIEHLQKRLSCEIICWDERLTSVLADRFLREASMSRKKRAQKSDSVAAMIILQNYLDYKLAKDDPY